MKLTQEKINALAQLTADENCLGVLHWMMQNGGELFEDLETLKNAAPADFVMGALPHRKGKREDDA